MHRKVDTKTLNKLFSDSWPTDYKDRTLRPGGAVALYVRDSLFGVRRSEFEILKL